MLNFIETVCIRTTVDSRLHEYILKLSQLSDDIKYIQDYVIHNSTSFSRLLHNYLNKTLSETDTDLYNRNYLQEIHTGRYKLKYRGSHLRSILLSSHNT
jgi:hypothetical protein